MEELDNEDGFVLYTANQQNKRYKVIKVELCVIIITNI